MYRFTSRFGWDVTGTVDGYGVNNNGQLMIMVTSEGGMHMSFPAADMVVDVSPSN